MSPAKRKIRLQKRDWQILRHTFQHGGTTVEALHALKFSGQKRNAVKSTLRRLCGQPPNYLYLRPEPLDARRVYYRLTHEATRLLGVSKEAARPLGPQAKVERYALLWFVCIDRPGKRSLFNPRDFPEQFDIGANRLPRANFYLEETPQGETRLGYILVDHGTDTRRIIRKAGDRLLRFLRQGWFDDYIRERAFALTVLTLTTGKQRAILRQLEPYLQGQLRYLLSRFATADAEFPIPLQVTVVPQLTNLIAGQQKETE